MGFISHFQFVNAKCQILMVHRQLGRELIHVIKFKYLGAIVCGYDRVCIYIYTYIYNCSNYCI